MKVIDICYPFVIDDREDVDIVVVETDDLAFLAKFSGFIVFSFDDLCFFESHFRCKLLHLIHQFVADSPCVSTEYFRDFLDFVHVFLMRLFTYAWCFAVVDVVFKTRVVLLLLYTFFSDVEPASSDGVDVVDEVEHVVECTLMREWSIVFPCSFYDLPCFVDSWEILVADADRGVCFVVLQ